MDVYTQYLPFGIAKSLVYPPQRCPACLCMRSLFTNQHGMTRCYLCAKEDACDFVPNAISEPCDNSKGR